MVDNIAPRSNTTVHIICLRKANGNLYSVICSMHQIIPIKQYIATSIALNNNTATKFALFESVRKIIYSNNAR